MRLSGGWIRDPSFSFIASMLTCNSSNAMIIQQMKSLSEDKAKDNVNWGFCSEVVNTSGLGNLSKIAVGGFATYFNEDVLLSHMGWCDLQLP